MSKTAMIPEDIQKKIEERADRYAILKSNPFGGKIYLPQLNTGFSDGAEFGYSLSQSKIQELEKENERLRGLIVEIYQKEAANEFDMIKAFRLIDKEFGDKYAEVAGSIKMDYFIEKAKQFKEQNNL